MVFKYVLLFLVAAFTVGWVAAASSAGEGCTLLTIDPDTGNPVSEYATCIPYTNCAYAKGEACRGHLPQMCSSDPEDDSVCCRSLDCPPLLPSLVKVPLTGYKAWDYCVSLAEKAHPCLDMGDSITRSSFCLDRKESENGDAVVRGDYPHLALLSADPDDWISVSFGTLVSETWVLTSGSVADNDGFKFAKIGGLTDGVGGNPYNIVERVPHEKFITGELFDDIGLLKLDRKVVFSKFVLPACLHTGNALPKETLKDIITVADVFTSMDVEILPHEECSEVFDDKVGAGGVRETTQFCIKQKNDEDLEVGTAGAPLQVNNGDTVACTQTVLGVFSGSEGQVHLTTRVAAYIPWIEENVWPIVPPTSQRKNIHSIIQSIFKR